VGPLSGESAAGPAASVPCGAVAVCTFSRAYTPVPEQLTTSFSAPKNGPVPGISRLGAFPLRAVQAMKVILNRVLCHRPFSGYTDQENSHRPEEAEPSMDGRRDRMTTDRNSED
jgi:hypothetical protein